MSDVIRVLELPSARERGGADKQSSWERNTFIAQASSLLHPWPAWRCVRHRPAAPLGVDYEVARL